MVHLYTCDACVGGEHSKCAKVTPCEPGCYGGSKCTCGCNGDPDWMTPSKIHKEMMRQLKNIEKFEKASKKTPKNPMKIGGNFTE